MTDERDVDTAGSSKPPRFQIKKWSSVCLWSWDIMVENVTADWPRRRGRTTAELRKPTPRVATRLSPRGKLDASEQPNFNHNNPQRKPTQQRKEASTAAYNMRIDVRLPMPAVAGSSSSVDPEIACPQIAKLAGTGELILIELQGSLELEGLDPSTSQMIGTLTFEGPQGDKPVLLVSHHRLYGKFVDLHQPLAVLQKFSREPPVSIDSSPSAKRRWLEAPWTSDLDSGYDLDQDEDHDDDDDGGHGLDGLTSHRKRKKRAAEGEGDEGGPASSSPPPPDSSPCHAQKKDGREGFPTGSPSKSNPTSQMLSNTRADDNDEDDDDDDDDDDEDGEEEDYRAAAAADDSTATARPLKRRRHARQPRVWYDVKCLIKRKILFAKRPEPVVNLVPEERTAQTLGSQAVAAVKATS